MKKLFMVLGFLTLLLSSLSARFIFDGKIIFTSHATNKDSLAYLIIEKASGVLDTFAIIDTLGNVYLKYKMEIWDTTISATGNRSLRVFSNMAGYSDLKAIVGNVGQTIDAIDGIIGLYGVVYDTTSSGHSLVGVYGWAETESEFGSSLEGGHFVTSVCGTGIHTGVYAMGQGESAANVYGVYGKAHQEGSGQGIGVYGEGDVGVYSNGKTLLGKGSDIASASTIEITNSIHDITGTATIDSIVPGYEGQIVILKFDGIASLIGLRDGAKNLRLEGDFNYTPNDVITLYHEENLWYEISRSVN